MGIERKKIGSRLKEGWPTPCQISMRVSSMLAFLDRQSLLPLSELQDKESHPLTKIRRWQKFLMQI
jgi:hypothetical protein